MAGLEKKVLEKVKFVGNVHQITKDWGSSKTAPERSMLYNAYAANMLETEEGNPNPFEKVNPKDFGDTLNNMDSDAIYRHLLGRGRTYAGMFVKDYGANKAELAKVVKAKLDGMMAGKDAPHAIDEIKGYFADIVKAVLGLPDEIDDATAIEMQKRERLAKYGLADWSVMDAPSSEYKTNLMGITLRNKVGDMFVREEMQGDKKSYVVDENALAQVMGNVLTGCMLYNKVAAKKQGSKKKK